MVMEAPGTLDDAVRSPTCAVERSFAPLRGAHKLLIVHVSVSTGQCDTCISIYRSCSVLHVSVSTQAAPELLLSGRGR